MAKSGRSPDFDAVVIGAGITGIYQVYTLRELGFSVKGIEGGSDVGGTWYWNRYPGCRLDTPSFAYGYLGLNGLVPEWSWSETFASQPEILRYVKYAADKMDIRKDFQFDTRLAKAEFDDDADIWELTLDDDSTMTCRFLLSATGPLSATRIPDYPGIPDFKGEAYHSSRWPAGPDGGPAFSDFSGKRVGVIGTGATGVQIIPKVAETAEELYVFQRSPNWCTPLGNTPISPEEMEDIRKRRETILEYIKSTPTAFPYHFVPKNAVDVSEEERNAFFEKLYATPGYGIWLGNYQDFLVNPVSNKFLADFMADKIRRRVDDPVVAEKLIPKDHPFGTRRVPMETNYYEAYNKPNVHLVDIKEAPIQHFTEDGIQTADAFYDLDMVIFATGFDAITGELYRMDIRGKSGLPLKEAWAEGPMTQLGLMSRGFPNFFTLVGPHNGANFCNVGVCGGLQVEWVTRMLTYLRDHGVTRCEPTDEAQEKWTEHCYSVFEQTLMADVDTAWWVKVTERPDGTKITRALAYLGGATTYRQHCEESAYAGYEGFEMA